MAICVMIRAGAIIQYQPTGPHDSGKISKNLSHPRGIPAANIVMPTAHVLPLTATLRLLAFFMSYGRGEGEGESG
eukprot:CAMPEP_0182562910 /NCGR_PEP_ID=MMETSP1324-20130603/5175_1 /TAXON_ID=236786 /ORGANISM="Florenciella sp., Strain RCC1587" /LENGTH=74 /DNA_ID=CAMNT_0024775985 /DNA_START=153 /DNA_END=373 /DNA_ORIENTATION=+